MEKRLFKNYEYIYSGEYQVQNLPDAEAKRFVLDPEDLDICMARIEGAVYNVIFDYMQRRKTYIDAETCEFVRIMSAGLAERITDKEYEPIK